MFRSRQLHGKSKLISSRPIILSVVPQPTAAQLQPLQIIVMLPRLPQVKSVHAHARPDMLACGGICTCVLEYTDHFLSSCGCMHIAFLAAFCLMPPCATCPLHPPHCLLVQFRTNCVITSHACMAGWFASVHHAFR